MSVLTKFVYKPLSWIYRNDYDIYSLGFTGGALSIAVLYYHQFAKLTPTKHLTTTCMVAVVVGGGLFLLAAMKYLKFKNEIDVQEDTIEESSIQIDSLAVTEVASDGLNEQLVTIRDKFLEMEKKVNDEQEIIIKESSHLNEFFNDACKAKSREFDVRISVIQTDWLTLKNKVTDAKKLISEDHHLLRRSFLKHIEEKSDPTKKHIDTVETELAELKNEIMSAHNGIIRKSGSLGESLRVETETRKDFKGRIDAAQKKLLDMKDKANIEQADIIKTFRIIKRDIIHKTETTINSFKEEFDKVQTELLKLESETKNAQKEMMKEHRLHSEIFLEKTKTASHLFEAQITAIQNQEIEESNIVWMEYRNLIETFNYFIVEKGEEFKKQNAAIPKAFYLLTNGFYRMKKHFEESMDLLKSLITVNEMENDAVEKSDHELKNEFSILTNEIDAMKRIFDDYSVLKESLKNE